MNTNSIISLPVAADLGGHEHETVKLTSTGINLAGATDRVIGTLIRAQTKREDGGSVVGMSAAVFLAVGNGLHKVKCGNNTAIALGDELERDSTSGRLVKKVSGLAVAVAAEAIPATSDGGIFNVIMLPTAEAGIEPVTLTGVALTGAGGGTANGALEDELTLATAGGNTYSDAAVNTVIGKIKNNIAELAVATAANRVDIAAINTALGA